MCGNVFQSHTCEIPPHLLAISSGHNTQQREQSPNALIHWTAALLLLRWRNKARCSASTQPTLPYLCHFAAFSFVFTPLTDSFHLFVISLSNLWFFLLYVPIFQSLLIFLSFIFPLSDSTPKSPQLSFSSNSIQQAWYPICFRPRPPHSTPLYAPEVCRQSFVYVNTTSIPKPFPLSFPKARTSYCFIPQWAQGETRQAVRQPSDPSSVIRKGKGTLLIEGGSIEGLGGWYEGCYSSVGGGQRWERVDHTGDWPPSCAGMEGRGDSGVK